MLKKLFILVAIATSFSCQARRPDLSPPAGPHFRFLSIKFNFHDGESRQSGRVLWRFDESSSKFVFFTPLNQVGMELDVAGEEAVLVNFRSKTFWRGDFRLMLDRLWGIGLTLSALRSLLLDGAAPAAEFLEQGIAVLLERSAGTGAPSTVRLRRGDVELVLRVLTSELRPGRVILVNYAGRYRGGELEDVLEQ